MSTKTQPKMPLVQLSAIVIGKTNPRKVFDEDAISELAESVKAKGVIQPILLRPIGDTLELVCGERRYRASIMAGLTEIPAYIRELTDDEALEAQITENLQRKDVHPMEEAFAFKQLLEKKDMAEVVARFGKKEYFINQRLKLNELTAEWQKLFYKNAIGISDAIKVAVLPVATQASLLKACGVDKTNIDKKHPFVIADYHFRSFSGALSSAPFDTKDPSLDKKMGSCGGCTFNSAFANLFPEAIKNPICSNITCYKNKSDVNFNMELKKALEDPAIIFISTNYHVNDDKITDRLKKEKHDILTSYKYNGVGIQDSDIEPFDEWKEGEDDELSDEELQADYAEYVARLTKQKEQTEKRIATGKYLKAFIVDGTGKGAYKYIELQKQSSSKNEKVSAKDRIESGKATAEDIDAEISRIRDREKRSKELDQEKVHERIVEAMKADSTLKQVPTEFTSTDKVLLRFLLSEYITYQSRDDIKKAIGLSNSAWENGTPDKLYQKLENLTDVQVAYLVRMIIFDKFNNSFPRNSGGFMVRKLAEQLGTVPIAAYETEQKEKAEKRLRNVEKRVVELQEQKKLLKPKPEPKAKPVNKKAKAK